MFSKNKKDHDETLDTIDTDTIEENNPDSPHGEVHETDQLDATAVPKKKLPAWVIIPIIAVLGVGVFAASKFSTGTDKTQGVSLNVTTVKTGDIKEIYNASGKIESENTKTYYSPVTAPISKCTIAVGDTVKAGDVIVSFDTTNLERDNQKAQLSLQTSLNTTQASHSQNAKAIDSASASSNQAANQANSLANTVNDLGAQVDAAWNTYQENIAVAEAAAPEQEELAKSIAELHATIETNKSIIHDTETNYVGGRTELDTANAKKTKDENDLAIIDALGPIFDKYDESVEIVKNSEKELAELQLLVTGPIDDAGYAALQAQYDAAYAQWEAAYNAASTTPTPDAGMSSAEAANLEISDNMAELTALTPAELVVKGKEGMKADMNGVIASVDVLQSNAATQGMAMFTIATTDKVRMKIEVSPDDYDKMQVGNEAHITVGEYKYKGKLTKVNKIAVNNEKGNPVIGAQIRIENPDKNLCIGATAKVSMTVAESKNVLTIPTEVINTSSEGDFVYIIKDGIVEKKDVELGTSSTASIEVKSGLEEGDQVVNDLNVDIKEGMKATPLDTEAIADKKTDKK